MRRAQVAGRGINPDRGLPHRDLVSHFLDFRYLILVARALVHALAEDPPELQYLLVGRVRNVLVAQSCLAGDGHEGFSPMWRR
jgi:hypothetical protein